METNVCNIVADVKIKIPELVGLKENHKTTIVKVNEVEIGGSEVIIIAGPCAVESEEQLFSTARSIKEDGAKLLRGGAFKPRSSPYSFQGLGEEGLKLRR